MGSAGAVAEAWRVDVGRGLAAPLVAWGHLLIAAAASRDVTALDPGTGERVWRRRVAGPVLGGATVHEDRVFVATGDERGRAIALDAATGAELWSAEVGPVAHRPAHSMGRLVIASETGEVVSLDAATGDRLWRNRLPRPAVSAPAPTADGSRIVIPAQDTLYVLAAATGLIEWSAPLGAPAAGPPALHGEMAYVPLRSGEVVAVSLDARREAWRVRLGEEPVLATPVVASDGALFVLDRAADLWRVAPGGGQPGLVARLGGAAAGSLALVGDGLLVGRVDGALFLVRAADGGVAWRHDLGDAIRTPATPHGGAIYVPLLAGRVARLEAAP